MSDTKFWDHPIETIEEALSIKKQIDSLQSKLDELFGSKPASALKPAGRRRRRKISAAARARMAAGQKLRWARVKGKSAAAAKPGRKPRKKKRNLTPEGRARLAAAMKARWAARKKGAPAPNARR